MWFCVVITKQANVDNSLLAYIHASHSLVYICNAEKEVLSI